MSELFGIILFIGMVIISQIALVAEKRKTINLADALRYAAGRLQKAGDTVGLDQAIIALRQAGHEL